MLTDQPFKSSFLNLNIFITKVLWQKQLAKCMGIYLYMAKYY